MMAATSGYEYNRKEDVIMSSFSSWGPTDDGRIKPDVVGDGVNILSTSSSAVDRNIKEHARRFGREGIVVE